VSIGATEILAAPIPNPATPNSRVFGGFLLMILSVLKDDLMVL
jgi:hypothetical protein